MFFEFDHVISPWFGGSKRGSIFRGIELYRRRFSPCFGANQAGTTAAYYLDVLRFATIFWWLISPFVRRLATRTQGRLERTANTHLFIESRTACAVRVQHTCACVSLGRRIRACMCAHMCATLRGGGKRTNERTNERASNSIAKRKTCVRANSFVKKKRDVSLRRRRENFIETRFDSDSRNSVHFA